ncbi:hypothetical protein [Luteolibacter sp.]|uniref:hypothetical protein n=1 Tax=Luteolibacter sp. TaxID=1962973 RepID=UPI00326702CF
MLLDNLAPTLRRDISGLIDALSLISASGKAIAADACLKTPPVDGGTLFISTFISN